MLLANTPAPFIALEYSAVFAVKPYVIIPLLIACVAIVAAVPLAAARGKLHIPAYVALAFFAFAIALLFGWIAGVRAISGTIAGITLSFLLFLLMDTAAGSVLALFFYRQPPAA